jgi:hypothetical protein
MNGCRNSVNTNNQNRKPETTPVNPDRIRELQEQLSDLKKRWPAHSTPPSMIQRLDDLEEELENEMKGPNQD